MGVEAMSCSKVQGYDNQVWKWQVPRTSKWIDSWPWIYGHRIILWLIWLRIGLWLLTSYHVILRWVFQ
jgi:hypothetical protein